MKKRKIEIDDLLYQRASAKAQALGYSSLEEWVEHFLEKQLLQLTPEQQAQADEQLKGLGYL